jgi:hypothetical protein
MIAEFPPPVRPGRVWPCGPECRYGRTLPGTYGEWLWCDHPVAGGHVVRAGVECAGYDPTPRPPPVRPAAALPA